MKAEIWYLDLIKYAEFNGDVHVFRFRPKITFLGKFGHKIQNCFKVRFGTKTNSNMQNSMVMFTFSVFNQKYFF